MLAIVLAAALISVQPAAVDHPSPAHHAEATNRSQQTAQPLQPTFIVNVGANGRDADADKIEAHHKSPTPGEWGLIGVGVLQAGVLIWQIRYLTKTLRHERRATEHELRPYIFLKRAKLKEMGPDTDLIVSYAYKNTGKTPAKNVRVAVKAIIILSGRVIDLRNFGDAYPIGPLGPGDQIVDEEEIQVAESDIRPSLRSVAEWPQDESLEIHLFGRIDYADEFRDDRYTTFHSVFRKGPGKHMDTAKDGNDYR